MLILLQNNRPLGFVQSVVAVLNLLTLLVGVILLSVGTFIYFAPAAVFVSSTFLPHVVLVLGAAISLVSFLGYYGVTNEKPWVLRIFMSVLLIAIALQIAIGIIAFIYRNQSTEALDNAWSRFYRTDRRVLQDVETFFQCCGFNHLIDRAVPATCALDFDFYQSCRESIQTAFQDSLQAIGVIGAILGSIEMVSLIGVSLLFHRLGRNNSTPQVGGLDNTGQEALVQALLEANQLNQQIEDAYRQREQQRQERYDDLVAKLCQSNRQRAHQYQQEQQGQSSTAQPLLHQPQPQGPPPSYGSIFSRN